VALTAERDSRECKVCHALDTLPDQTAERLDRFLADGRASAGHIASAITAEGQPVSRLSVGRHRRGVCSLGINYLALAS
jgi:hypothetical protein